MNLKLKRPIAFFDLETTGINITQDRIIEICVIKVNPDQSEQSYHSFVNPQKPMSPEASAITGIKDEDLAGKPTFAQIAPELAKFLHNCDLGGFNSNKFDIPMLVEEFMRANTDFEIENRKFIDVQVIFHKKEQRTLSAAYSFYVGKNLDDAHSADADTRATYEVLKAQLDRYPDLPNDIEELSKFSSQTINVDFAGRMIYDENKVEIFNFGKYKGKKVSDILLQDPGYYSWMMQGDFPEYTKKKLTEIKMRTDFARKFGNNKVK